MPDWTRGKQIRVYILLGVILALTASFLTFDWTQVFLGLVRISDPERMYTRLTKTLTSCLVFLLVLSIGPDGVNPQDTKRLRTAFTVMFTGDLLFLMDELHPAFDYAAVVAFLVGHVLVIWRNGQGLGSYLQDRRSRLFAGLLLAGIAALTAILFVGTLLGRLIGSPLLYILTFYAIVLDISLWAGWMSLKAGYFPRPNAILIAAGATCFFFGDYLVGFNLTLNPSILRAFTLFATWVFYTPAITLIALSGYRWEKDQRFMVTS